MLVLYANGFRSSLRQQHFEIDRYYHISAHNIILASISEPPRLGTGLLWWFSAASVRSIICAPPPSASPLKSEFEWSLMMIDILARWGDTLVNNTRACRAPGGFRRPFISWGWFEYVQCCCYRGRFWWFGRISLRESLRSAKIKNSMRITTPHTIQHSDDGHFSICGDIVREQ